MKKNRASQVVSERATPPELERSSMVVTRRRSEPPSAEVTIPKLPSARRRRDAVPLYCPFESGLNPHVVAVQAASTEWAARHGLVPERGLARLDAAKIGWLPALVFHDAPRDVLQLAADWTTIFCLLDDHVEQARLGAIDLAAYLSDVLAGFRGRCPGPADALTAGLVDLAGRLRDIAGPRITERFSNHLAELFGAYAWEEINRRNGIRPSFHAYRTMRTITIGLHPQFVLGELAMGAELPDAVRQHPHVRQLEQSCSLCVGFANDIFTYEKELAEGEVHNVVLVFMESGNCSLFDATRRAAGEHDDEMRKFLSVQANLGQVGEDDGVRAYVGMLRAWIRGHLDWARETGRYSVRPRVSGR